jgi:hypothetical protein
MAVLAVPQSHQVTLAVLLAEPQPGVTSTLQAVAAATPAVPVLPPQVVGLLAGSGKVTLLVTLVQVRQQVELLLVARVLVVHQDRLLALQPQCLFPLVEVLVGLQAALPIAHPAPLDRQEYQITICWRLGVTWLTVGAAPSIHLLMHRNPRNPESPTTLFSEAPILGLTMVVVVVVLLQLAPLDRDQEWLAEVV